jgi:holliday junction DNA helicase RuvA
MKWRRYGYICLLYGFLNIDELDFFELLISISGIGPKGAIGILSVIDVGTLISAISSGDTSYLTKVSGIGKKSAEKIILELKDKVGILDSGDYSDQLREETEAIEALKSLGYRSQEARAALQKVSPEISGTSERVREALRVLGS